MRKLTCQAVLAVALAVPAMPLVAQSREAINLVPAEVEVLAHVDLRALIDSPLVQSTLDNMDRPRVDAFLQFAENLSGTNLLEDIDGAMLFGLLENDDSIGVVIEGRYDRDRLAPLLFLAPSYEVMDVDGQAVHSWFDKRENRRKFGVFLPNKLAVWNSREAMERSLAVLTRPAEAITMERAGELLGEQREHSVLRAGIVVRNPECGAARLRIATANLALLLDGDLITTNLTVEPDDPALVEDWEAMLKGGAALFRIQGERPALAHLAQSVTVEPIAGDKVLATMTVDVDEIPRLIKMRR